MKKTDIFLHFGANCASLRQQIRNQGFKADWVLVEPCQKDADNITRLSLRCMVSNRVVYTVRKKILDEVIRLIQTDIDKGA